jgi:hypothetical protein
MYRKVYLLFHHLLPPVPTPASHHSHRPHPFCPESFSWPQHSPTQGTPWWSSRLFLCAALIGLWELSDSPSMRKAGFLPSTSSLPVSVQSCASSTHVHLKSGSSQVVSVPTQCMSYLQPNHHRPQRPSSRPRDTPLCLLRTLHQKNRLSSQGPTDTAYKTHTGHIILFLANTMMTSL